MRILGPLSARIMVYASPMDRLPVTWFELGTLDAPRIQHFYSVVFSWTFRKDLGFEGHSLIETGGLRGGLWSIPSELAPYACPYIQVADLSRTIEQAVAAGGKQLLAPRAGPGTIRFAHIADPEGNRIGLFQS
jgi:predicted enzyme related to lactoylglutathione lyase